MKDGYGKMLSIDGEFIKAYFQDDQIQNGLVISSNGDYYYFDRQNQKAETFGQSNVELDHRNCYTR